MNVFRKLLDKLGFHKEQPTAVVGSTEVAPPDPLTTAPTEASKAASQQRPVPPARRPGGAAPVSEKGKKGNTERLR
jgi:hypothetical protein